MSSGRRDFLTWLLAAPAVAGCAAETADVGSSPSPSTSPALPSEPDHDDPDGENEGDPETTEQAATSCRITTRDAEGPYFEPGSPLRSLRIAELNEPGVRLVVEGRLLGPDCRTPLRGYKVDVWQADKNGNYFDVTSGFRLRGKVVSDSLGRYKFETVLPGRYGDSAGIRPAHLHLKVLTPQNNTLLTTQLYFAGDPYLGTADYCTRMRTCNSSDVARQLRLTDALVSSVAGKRARFDAILSRS